MPPSKTASTSGQTRFSFGPGAGMLLAVVLGAAPAAWMGLDLAWIVVAIGATVLLLAPWVARRQVHAVRSVKMPASCTVHAGKVVPISLTLEVARPARMLLAALVRTGDPRGVRERAPKTLIVALGPAGPKSGTSTDTDVHLSLPLRAASRGRSSEIELVLQSSYPLGLVTASRSLVVPLELTALPRLLPERDLDLQRTMVHLAGLTDQATARHVTRGEGLPSGLRDARVGESRRHLHMRASLRRGRWTAMERPELGNELAEVTLHLPAMDGHPSRRSHAAFEAATSVTASVVQGLHRLGMDVDLGTRSPSSTDPGSPPPRRLSLGRSRTTLPHLQHLTDVSMVPGPARATTPRAKSAAALVVNLIPVTSLLESAVDGAQPAGTSGGPSAMQRRGDAQLTLWVDANGRVSRRGHER